MVFVAAFDAWGTFDTEKLEALILQSPNYQPQKEDLFSKFFNLD